MLILAVIFLGWALTLVVAVGPHLPLGIALHNSAPGVLYGIQAGLSRYFGPYPWDYVVGPLMELPSWIPPVGCAVLCGVAHVIALRKQW